MRQVGPPTRDACSAIAQTVSEPIHIQAQTNLRVKLTGTDSASTDPKTHPQTTGSISLNINGIVTVNTYARAWRTMQALAQSEDRLPSPAAGQRQLSRQAIHNVAWSTVEL